MSQTVLTSFADGVTTLTLNRPERLNAMNGALVDDLLAALRAADADEATRAIVLCGAGRAFCSGDDLKDFPTHSQDEATAQAFIETIQDITRVMVLGDTMVVGAVHGWAVGGGFEWAINCDLLILAEGTRCFFPEISWGMFVTGGVTALLPRLVGLQRAREMILFGEKYDAAELHAMQLAWRVVPEVSLSDVAQETAARIAALPQASVRDLKRVLNRASGAGVEEALTLETGATLRALLDPAAHDLISTFKS
jgi:enoyl-CoA hydratase/carnithine racemase